MESPFILRVEVCHSQRQGGGVSDEADKENYGSEQMESVNDVNGLNI
jgi:hypothetical protein